MASTTTTTTSKSQGSNGSRCFTRLPDPDSPGHSFSSSSSPSPHLSSSFITRQFQPDPTPRPAFRIGIFSSGNHSPVMDFTPVTATAAATNGHGSPRDSHFPSSFTKFNSALTAGLLNPMSPPPPPLLDKTRSSPTLFEMMASEGDSLARTPVQIHNGVFPLPSPSSSSSAATGKTANHIVISAQEKQALAMQRISDLLMCRSPGNQFNDPTSSDVKLTLSSKDAISITMSVHRQILVAHSRFFAMKLSDRWSRQQRPPSSSPYIVEISDCDDVEVYIETLMLMYCRDLRKKLMRHDVPRVLGILKVSAAIGFDAGVLSCLEYLEAAPWSEDEEEKIASLLSELHLENVGATEVLRRVSSEACHGNNGSNGNNNDEVLLKLLHVVLEGKDEKARRDMKTLVSKMLRENSSGNDLRKESLYLACDGCLQMLKQHFLQAAASDMECVDQIARQADNLHWVLDILIDRQIAEDFLVTWASLSELSEAHAKIPAVHRYEISRVTARLFVGIGKGQILAPKEVRCLLLRNWLTPFYNDFGWMRRASKGLDRYLIEDGLSNTILTLPLASQQDFFLAWFDRFLNSSEDCPNIQRGFQVWWRRSFWRRKYQTEEPARLRITAVAAVDDS